VATSYEKKEGIEIFSEDKISLKLLYYYFSPSTYYYFVTLKKY